MSENPDEPVNECPHENAEYDGGNYVPPFGWEQRPGMFCVDCGEEVEQEEIEIDPSYYDVDPITMYEELRDEARNPL